MATTQCAAEQQLETAVGRDVPRDASPSGLVVRGGSIVNTAAWSANSVKSANEPDAKGKTRFQYSRKPKVNGPPQEKKKGTRTRGHKRAKAVAANLVAQHQEDQGRLDALRMVVADLRDAAAQRGMQLGATPATQQDAPPGAPTTAGVGNCPVDGRERSATGTSGPVEIPAEGAPHERAHAAPLVVDDETSCQIPPSQPSSAGVHDMHDEEDGEWLVDQPAPAVGVVGNGPVGGEDDPGGPSAPPPPPPRDVGQSIGGDLPTPSPFESHPPANTDGGIDHTGIRIRTQVGSVYQDLTPEPFWPAEVALLVAILVAVALGAVLFFLHGKIDSAVYRPTYPVGPIHKYLSGVVGVVFGEARVYKDELTQYLAEWLTAHPNSTLTTLVYLVPDEYQRLKSTWLNIGFVVASIFRTATYDFHNYTLWELFLLKPIARVMICAFPFVLVGWYLVICHLRSRLLMTMLLLWPIADLFFSVSGADSLSYALIGSYTAVTAVVMYRQYRQPTFVGWRAHVIQDVASPRNDVRPDINACQDLKHQPVLKMVRVSEFRRPAWWLPAKVRIAPYMFGVVELLVDFQLVSQACGASCTLVDPKDIDRNILGTLKRYHASNTDASNILRAQDVPFNSATFAGMLVRCARRRLASSAFRLQLTEALH